MVPRGSIYTTIMELGPQNHNGDGRLGLNSTIVVYMDPLGSGFDLADSSEGAPGVLNLVATLNPET